MTTIRRLLLELGVDGDISAKEKLKDVQQAATSLKQSLVELEVQLQIVGKSFTGMPTISSFGNLGGGGGVGGGVGILTKNERNDAQARMNAVREQARITHDMDIKKLDIAKKTNDLQANIQKTLEKQVSEQLRIYQETSNELKADRIMFKNMLTNLQDLITKAQPYVNKAKYPTGKRGRPPNAYEDWFDPSIGKKGMPAKRLTAKWVVWAGELNKLKDDITITAKQLPVEIGYINKLLKDAGLDHIKTFKDLTEETEKAKMAMTLLRKYSLHGIDVKPYTKADDYLKSGLYLENQLREMSYERGGTAKKDLDLSSSLMASISRIKKEEAPTPKAPTKQELTEYEKLVLRHSKLPPADPYVSQTAAERSKEADKAIKEIMARPKGEDFYAKNAREYREYIKRQAAPKEEITPKRKETTLDEDITDFEVRIAALKHARSENQFIPYIPKSKSYNAPTPPPPKKPVRQLNKRGSSTLTSQQLGLPQSTSKNPLSATIEAEYLKALNNIMHYQKIQQDKMQFRYPEASRAVIAKRLESDAERKRVQEYIEKIEKQIRPTIDREEEIRKRGFAIEPVEKAWNWQRIQSQKWERTKENMKGKAISFMSKSSMFTPAKDYIASQRAKRVQTAKDLALKGAGAQVIKHYNIAFNYATVDSDKRKAQLINDLQQALRGAD